uniref:Type II toxin-antitoxin system HicA family toxin n=1 Tax=Desulfobacca acetoxidans TaxID=60893 RepID=A0A7V6DPD6_9BACT
MGKFRVLSGTEVCQILSNHGFREVRRRGSHILMQKILPGSTITIPIPDHRKLKISTLLSIIRQSGIPKGEFES